MAFLSLPLAVLILSLANFFSRTGAIEITVSVGRNNSDTEIPWRFKPEFVTAQFGDVIVFVFGEGRYRIAEGTFEHPCIQRSGGIYTNLIETPQNATPSNFTRAPYPLQHTKPVWIHSTEPGQCASGMVFAINPGAQFEAYKAAAVRTGFNVVVQGRARSIREADNSCNSIVTTTSLSLGESTAAPHHSSGDLRTARAAGLAMIAALWAFMYSLLL